MNTKKCRICGDKANGFNYDGLSCESCKVFFCRNSDKVEILKCELSNNCFISIATRKKCPKCRLIKCLSIGMKRKRFNSNKNECSLIENGIQKGIEPLLEISILKFLSDIDLKSLTKYVSNQASAQLQQRRRPLVLNQFELERISEAQNAIGYVFRDERAAPIVKYIDSHDNTLSDPLEMYVMKGVNFCQHFVAFNSLTNEDQLGLLKPFVLDLLGLWFTFQWHAKKQGTLMFTDNSQTGTYFIPNEVGLKYYNNKREQLKTMIAFGYAMHDAMEDDCVNRDLLCAMHLFKRTENLASPENIRYHHHLYIFSPIVIIVVVSFIYFGWVFTKYGLELVQNRTPIVDALFWITISALCGMLFGLLSICFYLDFAHSVALNFSCTVSLLAMFYQKVGQVWPLLSGIVNKQSKSFPLLKYIRYRRHSVQDLAFFFAVNRFHGRLFCAFLVACTPSNIILTMWIIQAKLEFIAKMIVYFWIVYQFYLLFVFHCIFAQCTKLIHKPCKQLCGIIIQNDSPQMIAIRTRVHIANSIAALNTQNRYGFTYGDFGLVSLNTFAKFSQLYAKFCLISYKIMKKQIID